MSRFDCFAISHRGSASDENEDYAALDGARGIFVVADGLGGRAGGARASRIAAESFVRRVGESTMPVDDTRLRAIVSDVNRELRGVGERDPQSQGLGTT